MVRFDGTAREATGRGGWGDVGRCRKKGDVERREVQKEGRCRKKGDVERREM
jgi:hypothetical protein